MHEYKIRRHRLDRHAWHYISCCGIGSAADYFRRNFFSFRAEIILIAFMVILVTLVLQDLSLPLLIRTLDLVEDRSTGQEERQARELAAMAALVLLDEVASEDWPVQKHIEQLRVHYGRRRQRYADVEATNAECTKEVAEAFRRLRHETLTAERLTVINLWKVRSATRSSIVLNMNLMSRH
jgi:integrase